MNSWPTTCPSCGGVLDQTRMCLDEIDFVVVGELVCRGCGQVRLYSRRAAAVDGVTMAKKKTAKQGKKPTPKKGKPARKKGPRSQPLPGMEQVRNVRLDHYCESIGESREKTNALRREEKNDLQGALRVMHDRNVVVYRHAGVELVRIPGEEKLRVRTTKEDASDISAPDPETVIDAEDDEPEPAGGE